MKRDPRRRILWTFGILAILCPCTLCGVGYLVVQDWFGGPAQALPHEIEMARKEGIPLDPDDLRPKPPVPDDQNAATLYRVHFPAVKRVADKHNKLTTECSDLAKGKAKKEEIADIEAALLDAREALTEVVAASKRPYCDFHYQFEKGAELAMPEYAQARTAVKMLAAKAHLLADRGQVSEAYGLLIAAQAVGRHAGMGPLLIAALVQIAIEGIVMEEFSHLLQLSSRDAALLAKAHQALDGFGGLVDLRYAFRGEVVLGLVSIRKIHNTGDIRSLGDLSGGQFPEGDKGGGFPLPESIVKGYESKFVSTWRSIFEQLPTDSKDWVGAYNVMQGVDRKVAADKSPANMINAILFPVFSQAALAIGHQDANRRIAATSIRLMQEHLRTGSYPVALPDYGAISVDPFDGKPLRYRREGTGFTIYSIDRDFEDNGGVPRKGTKHGDLVRTFRGVK